MVFAFEGKVGGVKELKDVAVEEAVMWVLGLNLVEGVLVAVRCVVEAD